MQQKITLWPPVQHLSITNYSDCFNIPSVAEILWLAPCPPPLASAKLAESKGIKLKFVQTEGRFALNVSNHSLPALESFHDLGEQGYKIEVTSAGINAFASSYLGLSYALLRTFELLKQSALPELTITDWPNTNNRGIMIDLARVVESPAFLISLLPFLAECRLNQIYLYLENKLVFNSHPQFAHPMAWTRHEMRDFINAAKGYGIEIIPMVATIGHMESILSDPEYRHLQAANTNDHLDTALPEARGFMSDLVEEVCEIFESQYVHLAGDECPYLGVDSQETTAKYAEFMNFMAKILKRHGRQGIIWADMVVKYPELLKSLSKDLILTDWRYHPVDNHPVSLPDEFMRAGFDTAVAPGILADEPFLPTIERLTRNLPFLSRKSGLWGVINCMWEPRTQTLPVARLGIAAAGACAWNPFAVEPEKIISQASGFTYGEDISELYHLLEGGKFFDMMVQSKFAFYHSFELSCNNPLLHLAEPESADWEQLALKINDGFNRLEKSKHLFAKHSEDFKAFRACATLAKTLADSVVLMRETGKIINAGAKPDQFAEIKVRIQSLIDFMQETLSAQRAAWKVSRRTEDPNYNWWFKDPLQYKMKCLNTFVDCLDNLQKSSSTKTMLPELNYLLFRFNKGDAASWNLLRTKIFYSDCGSKWEQVFFKTIPLWMDDCLELKLMSYDGVLPNYIKIVPVYATWHQPGPWDDMIKVFTGTLKLASDKLCSEYTYSSDNTYSACYETDQIMLKKH